MRLSKKLEAAYWQAMPTPYEIDMRNEHAMLRHIKRILGALSKDQVMPEIDPAPKQSVAPER